MSSKLLELTVEVVASYVSNNHVQKSELGQLLAEVNETLQDLGSRNPAPKQEPAADPTQTVHRDHLICLECGNKYRSLRKHIIMKHRTTPEEYREKWGLPGDYPMIAPGFSEVRSRVAKTAGLGEKGKIERKHWRKFR